MTVCEHVYRILNIAAINPNQIPVQLLHSWRGAKILWISTDVLGAEILEVVLNSSGHWTILRAAQLIQYYMEGLAYQHNSEGKMWYGHQLFPH